MVKYQVQSLDVWGHAPSENCEICGESCIDSEGFSVNQAFSIRTIAVPDDATDEAIIDLLIGEELLKPAARGAVEIDDANGMGEHLTIQATKDGEPIYWLVKQEDAS